MLDNAIGAASIGSAASGNFTATQTPARGPFSAVGVTEIDTTGYQEFHIDITANGSANTVVMEGSADGGTTWRTVFMRNDTLSAAFGSASSTTGTGPFRANAVYPRMRVRVSNYVGTSTTVYAWLKRTSVPGFNETYRTGVTKPFTESTSALGGGASVNGSSRDLATYAGNTSSDFSYSFFACDSWADQAGTLFLQISTDGTTWRNFLSVATSANIGSQLRKQITTRFNRCSYTNGGAAQGAFALTSSYGAN